MKRKFLCTLLCVTMAFSTLVGCGAKETTPTNESVETKENESIEEVSETVTEETNNANEEVDETITEETNNTGEEVVEETFVESEWKKENIVYGETRTTPFGSYVVVGPLEENPNLEQYEIDFDGHIFQVAMPKDVGDRIEYNEETNTINFFNKDNSKIVGITYTKGAFDTLDAYYSCYYAIEDLGVDTTNEEIIILDEKIYSAYQFAKGGYYKNLAYLSCWNIGTEKTYDGTLYENVGYNYRLFYGENNETFNRETVKTIMESFTFLAN